MSQETGLTIVSSATEIVPAAEFVTTLSTAEVELNRLKAIHAEVSMDVSDSKKLEALKEVWRAYRVPRLALKKKVDGTLADMRDQLKTIGDNAKRIVSGWEAEEDKYDAVIKAEIERKKQEEAALVLAEKNRIEAGIAHINTIKLLPSKYVASTSAEIAAALAGLCKTEFSEHDLLEFFDEAVIALNNSINQLQDMLAAKQAAEAEAARIEAERIAEAARIKAEADQLAKDRAEFEAQKAAEEAKRAEQAKALQQAADARQAEIDAENAATQAEIKRKQAELDRQAELIAQQQAETQRIEQAKVDAKKRKVDEAKAEQERVETERKAQAETEQHKAWLTGLSNQEAWEFVLDRVQNDPIAQEVCREMLHRILFKNNP